RRPCVLYSVTGSNAQARDKLHGLVWLRSDFTVLVRLKHTSARLKAQGPGASGGAQGDSHAAPQ
ncbi:hypothetical protein LGN11_29985, partial [Burkholderia multivorans]|nr:hypothetical protein [Burkholderia multivorans]